MVDLLCEPCLMFLNQDGPTPASSTALYASSSHLSKNVFPWSLQVYLYEIRHRNGSVFRM